MNISAGPFLAINELDADERLHDNRRRVQKCDSNNLPQKGNKKKKMGRKKWEEIREKKQNSEFNCVRKSSPARKKYLYKQREKKWTIKEKISGKI